jgi:hypothetical protein
LNGLGKPSVRAVVYTRKSSEEGLDQEFNSLDAQYDACTSYIASQRHEGWKLGKQRFDDGGVSGGTMDRPALKALLTEVDKGLVDMIVVYKIGPCLTLHASSSAWSKPVVPLYQSPNPSIPQAQWAASP